MRRAAGGNPDQLVYLDGGGCVLVIGVAFALAGAVFVYLSLTEPISLGGGQLAGLAGTIGCTALSLLFAVFGVAIAFSRSGLTIDRKARTANRWWGVWKPGSPSASGAGAPANVRVLSRPRLQHITDRTEVVVGRTVQTLGQQDRQQLIYPVRLECDPSLLIVETTDELEARHAAEEVARFLGLAIVDGSSGAEVRREADTLGQPLAERVKRMGLPASLPPAPKAMHLGYEREDAGLAFTAPRQPFDPFLLAYLAAPMLMSAALYFVLYRGQSLDDLTAEQRAPAIRGMVLILSLPLVCGLIGIGSAIYWGGRLTITLDGIGIRTRGWPFGSSFLPVEELDDVRVGKVNGLWRVSIGDFSVRSDPDAEILELQLIGKRRIVRFGRGGSRAELEWLRDVILKAIAG